MVFMQPKAKRSLCFDIRKIPFALQMRDDVHSFKQAKKSCSTQVRLGESHAKLVRTEEEING